MSPKKKAARITRNKPRRTDKVKKQRVTKPGTRATQNANDRPLPPIEESGAL